MTFTVRPAAAGDMDDIFHVRTSVTENRLSEAELAELGITPASLTRAIDTGSMRGWCAEAAAGGQVVGFSMIDLAEREVFALFVLPEAEGTGIGSALLAAAVDALFDRVLEPISLSTGRDSGARGFYERRGWRVTGSRPERGDVVMTLDPPACHIRDARPSDRHDIVRLMGRLASFDLPPWRSAEHIAEADIHLVDTHFDPAKGSRIGVFVAQLPGRRALAGVVVAQVRSDYFTARPTVHVEVLVVDEGVEGRGVGRALMDRAEAFAAEAGAVAVTLTVFRRNDRARKVYEALGYEPEFVQYRKGLETRDP